MEGRDDPSPAAPPLSAGEHAAHGLQVEADGEVRPLGRDDDGPHTRVSGQRVHGPRQVPPQVHPMALRASGRSSHKVATAAPSSCSMRSTGDSKPSISPMPEG